MSAAPTIELVGVGLVEQGAVVLRNVDWIATRDERWILLGPNGSGKTSILRLLSFSRGPSTGEVSVLGDRPLVMVTHHVEEIPLGITHALLLREGSVVAAGPIGETLTSATVSETYGISVAVASDRGRWSARVTDPA